LFVRFSEAGPAERAPLVLVHGQIVSSRYLVPLGEQLASRRRVYLPDLPGFGHSSKPSRVLTVSEQAEVLAAFMEAMGLQRAALIANSVGCQIVAQLAVAQPQLVDRLVLLGPTMDRRRRRWYVQAARWILNCFSEPRRELARIILRDCLDAGLRRGAITFRHALHDAIEEKLPRVQAPVLVVKGGRDPIVPIDWAEEITRLLPRGSLLVVPEGAHAMHYSMPATLAADLMTFLDEGWSSDLALGVAPDPTEELSARQGPEQAA
jgi:2-hydroxy-6-oxonona-2,4-dienedioate hydrolase